MVCACRGTLGCDVANSNIFLSFMLGFIHSFAASSVSTAGIRFFLLYTCAISSFEALLQGRLTKPLFVVWVEPFLIGGHCLFIHPSNGVNYRALFTESLYNYNVIAPEEYRDKNRQLLFKEAGCQSSYVPYGQQSINLLYPALPRFYFN
jgi:hypothetical protein